MSNIAELFDTNKKLQILDDKISEAISDVSKRYDISPAEISGVMRAIEFRLFFNEFKVK